MVAAPAHWPDILQNVADMTSAATPQAVVQRTETEDPPCHPVLGAFGIDAMTTAPKKRLAEVERWRGIGLAADFLKARGRDAAACFPARLLSARPDGIDNTHVSCDKARTSISEPPMQTLDDMLSRHLLTPEQHAQIAAWIAMAKTPQAILEMPSHLWRNLELASVLMGFDADMMVPAPLGESPE